MGIRMGRSKLCMLHTQLIFEHNLPPPQTRNPSLVHVCTEVCHPRTVSVTSYAVILCHGVCTGGGGGGGGGGVASSPAPFFPVKRGGGKRRAWYTLFAHASNSGTSDHCQEIFGYFCHN